MPLLNNQSFHLIRHGETEMNAKQLCCGGQVDTILTDNGRVQAGIAQRVLEASPVKPTLIIHSDMSRTRETCKIINYNLNIPVVANNSLREQDLGELENMPWQEAMHYFRNDIAPKNGESLDMFATRICTAINDSLSQYGDERILFVGHGGIFHSILRLYKQGGTDVFIPNATLHSFTPTPSFSAMPWQIDVLGLDDTGGFKADAANICPVRQLRA